MHAALLAPLAAALLAGLVGSCAHRGVSARMATWLLSAVLAMLVAASFAAMFILGFSFLAHAPIVGTGFAWCKEALGQHGAQSPWIGGGAFVLLVVGSVRAVQRWRAWRELRRDDPGAPEVVVSDALFAFALPGRGRRVVVSSALVAQLDRDEFEVVMAHERSHSEHRHDRPLLLADLAVAFLPLASGLRRRLAFNIERWADESAVAAAHGDREFVARTLARVALSNPPATPGVAALGGSGVADRVAALIEPGTRMGPRWSFAIMGAGVAGVAVASAIQLHHLAPYLVALCPG